MKNKIVFLILNYETYWETNKCIESIYHSIGRSNISSKAHEIVVVDNGSKNNSYTVLKENYESVDGIHLLKLSDNLGFAKGNNYGFRYAKERLAPDFIVMINSDIIMTDSDFTMKLVKGFNRYQFAVAGPDIRLKSGHALNVCYTRCLNKKDVKKSIKSLKYKIILCKLKVEPIYAICQRIVRQLKPREENFDRQTVLNLDMGEQLHGCFLIFSQMYIELFDGIYDKTFLYGEETLLRLRCKKAGLKICYLEDIKAIHNESRTEKWVNRGTIQRHLNRYITMINSMEVISKYMDSDDL